MKKILPFAHAKCVYDINPDFFTKMNVKYIFLDLDNTLATHKTLVPSKETLSYIKKLKENDLIPIIISNNKESRVKTFADKCDVNYIYKTCKPYTFKLLDKRFIHVPTVSIGGRPTRDILHASGRIVTGDTLDVFLVHFPSRSGGWRKSEKFRLMAAGILKSAADSVMSVRANPNVMIMGDFNDYPQNKSISEVLNASKPGNTVEKNMLYNLMDGREVGTYRYRGQWGILDQMIVNGNLLENGNVNADYSKACIIDFPFLLEEDDKYGGVTPFRMYNGMKYKGGYSDHLPVLLELEINY